MLIGHINSMVTRMCCEMYVYIHVCLNKESVLKIPD